MIRILAALSVSAGVLFAQGRVAPENLYPRVLCVVPMVGTGTPSDPRRPMFVPAPPVANTQTGPSTASANAAANPSDAPADPGAPPAATPRTGIIGFQYQLTDDGKSAIVELVGADRDALAEVFKAAVPAQAVLQAPAISATQVIVLDRDQTTRPQIEAAFKQYKQNFSLNNFVPVRVN
jgi:hypothetical protein